MCAFACERVFSPGWKTEPGQWCGRGAGMVRAWRGRGVGMSCDPKELPQNDDARHRQGGTLLRASLPSGARWCCLSSRGKRHPHVIPWVAP
eukprot:gene18564-biopygen20459